MTSTRLARPAKTAAAGQHEPDANAAPSTSRTLDVFTRIRADIMAGKLEPNSRLKIEDMRETYGTGLSPLREALSLLTSERLVDRIDQRGFRVAAASLAEFAELLETRCWLEERALRESMRHGDPLWEERLVLGHYRLERLQRSAGAGHAQINPAWETSHRAFHMALLDACGSSLLLRFCDQLYDMNIRYRQIAGTTAYPRRNIKTEHRAILDAVLARDVELAVARLTEHYRRTGANLKKGLT
jgi:GntR family transcriptional regulator, carbon starvation induced regulator